MLGLEVCRPSVCLPWPYPDCTGERARATFNVEVGDGERVRSAAEGTAVLSLSLEERGGGER